MKNKIFLILLSVFYFENAFTENLEIKSKNIILDKNKATSIFKDEVEVKTEENKVIKSNYAEYDRARGFLILKDKVIAEDEKGNKIEADFAEYDEKKKFFQSKGPTLITTSENYIIDSRDVIVNDKANSIISKQKTVITDIDNNKIYLDNFEYLTKENIFKSIGLIEIQDKMGNSYNFSQIYIDTKKKEILGTDIKAFLNQDSFKISEKNKPRVFSNSLKLNEKKSIFTKSIFTLCDYRKNDKCPPWSIQASKMLHDNKKKTIYYDNALLKVYDIPIFYFPKLSHPDPTVDRRSGFLPPSFSDSKNLGAGVSLPYFWAIDRDKNLTLTSNIFFTENPLFLSDYHQAFKNSDLMVNFGFTEGYKKTSSKKKGGDKSHLFAKIVKDLSQNKYEYERSLSVSLQNVSDDKYLKLYKIDSNLVDYTNDTLENSIDFLHEDEDIFLGFNASIYETLKEDYNDKYEYILPELTVDKTLLSNEKIGYLDMQTNLKVHTYDTNKSSSFLVNNFNWNFKEINYKNGFNSKILGNFKNINYESKNIKLYKETNTSEFFGAFGYLTELNLFKKMADTEHFLKPKMLIRYSPGSMRKEENGFRLNPTNAFSLDRLNNINNFETGLSGTIGFDFETKKEKNINSFDFSVAQILSEKENKKMHSKTSLDEKISDLVGAANYKVNEKINLNYNFSVDQNYNDVNYNEIGTEISFENLKVDFNYLEENKHIGDQQYFKTKFDLTNSDRGSFVFETKRNLISNSSEFYNLSYEYFNDCLRAGLIYRREFYNDSELEPENSLMFKITLTPFGDINSPSFNR